MKIVFASDHGGYELKSELLNYLKSEGHECCDYGCFSKERCDYPDFAFPAAEAVAKGEFERGIVVCTTGIGVSICANKVKNIRCALCTLPLQAEMTRRHNNSNMLALGASCVDFNTAKEIADIWLTTRFEGEDGGRHAIRVNKISEYENNTLGGKHV